MIGDAMFKGAQLLGLDATLLRSNTYRGQPEHDVAVFYGLSDGLRRIFDVYRRNRRAVYIDLGYWGRRKRTRYDGYHKVAVNSRHPTAYFQHKLHDHSRFGKFGIPVQPWRRRGRHILLAGMSAKAAAAEGFTPEQFEREAVRQIREFTDRPIVYRPKPNWLMAKMIPGARLQRGSDIPLAEALRNCHAVVTHHSNVGVDALLAGIPCITLDGVASVMGSRKFADIEDPPMPDGRDQWAADIAWTQWTVEEMRQGRAFRYLLDEGLI